MSKKKEKGKCSDCGQTDIRCMCGYAELEFVPLTTKELARITMSAVK